MRAMERPVNQVQPTLSSNTPAFPLSAAQLLCASRGFSCIFWGIPLGLLLFSSQSAGFHGAVSIRAVSGLRLPSYVLASLITYIGIIYLYRAGPLTLRWMKTVRLALLFVFLQLYFAPFYHWWDRMPHESFFMLNVLGLLASVIAWLFVVNKLAGAVGLAINDDIFYVEAKLCSWSVLALMAFPFVSIAGYGLVSGLRNGSSLYLELVQVSQQFPRWIYALFLLPFMLTMATTWKAKECCLHQLRRLERLALRTASPDIEDRPAPADLEPDEETRADHRLEHVAE